MVLHCYAIIPSKTSTCHTLRDSIAHAEGWVYDYYIVNIIELVVTSLMADLTSYDAAFSHHRVLRHVCRSRSTVGASSIDSSGGGNNKKRTHRALIHQNRHKRGLLISFCLLLWFKRVCWSWQRFEKVYITKRAGVRGARMKAKGLKLGLCRELFGLRKDS